MRGYFGLGQLSPSEKSDILDQHRTLYNGYQSMQPKVSNTQPLYVQDFAKDKNGVTMSNKGVVTHYTNFGINEQWQAAVGNAVIGYVANKAADKIVDTVSNSFQEETNEGDGESQMCEQCGGQTNEGICEQCGGSAEMEEETGHLDDIYDVEDFDPTAGFDYIEGSSNDVDTFEGMHHMKEQNGEVDELSTDELEKGGKYKYHTPSFEDEIEFDDEFGDENRGEKMYKFKGKDSMSHLMPGKHIENFVDYLDLGEQGGNSDDMDVDDVEPAYNFDSNGPMDGGDVYPVTEEGNMDEPEITYDTMESAWMDEEESFDDLINMDTDIESYSDNLEQMESDLDEVDVSGSQGIYADMDPAYDFDSGGAGPAGPYQRRNEQEFRPNVDLGKSFEKFKGKKSNDDGIESFFKNRLKSEKNIDNYDDLEDGELDVDFDKFDPREKSWEEITAHTGDDEFGGVDEDMVESLIIQKNRIMEMMNRMNVIK